MTKLECTLITCIHNDKFFGKCGICKLESVYLKWRFAADMGKGNIVCVECLQFDLGYKEEK